MYIDRRSLRNRVWQILKDYGSSPPTCISHLREQCNLTYSLAKEITLMYFTSEEIKLTLELNYQFLDTSNH